MSRAPKKPMSGREKKKFRGGPPLDRKETFSIAFERSWLVANFSKAFLRKLLLQRELSKTPWRKLKLNFQFKYFSKNIFIQGLLDVWAWKGLCKYL